MQRKHQMLAALIPLVTCAVLAFGTFTASAADASGTWTWSTPGRDGGEARVSTLKLKVDGEKLTGTLSSPGRQGAAARETAIENGKVTGDAVSFTVTREMNNNKFIQKYSGKLTADTIKGKVEFKRNDEDQSRDWEAKRETKK